MCRDELYDAWRPRGHVPRDEAHLPGAETDFTESEPDQPKYLQQSYPSIGQYMSIACVFNAIFLFFQPCETI